MWMVGTVGMVWTLAIDGDGRVGTVGTLGTGGVALVSAEREGWLVVV